jgi:hypothetical protein
MRHRVIASFIVVVLVATLTFSIVGMAQAPQRGGGERGAAAGGGRGNATPPPGPPHDPHDLNGVWLQRGGGVNRYPESEWSAQKIPFTPAGQAKFLANKPGKGPRAGLPANGNDPLGGANVPGLLRSLVYGRPFQFITSQDKVVQLFEWFRIWREIWTDGRKMPDDPGPRLYGYSVAHWEGDTFVVDTYGLDPRLWGDEWGLPFTDNLRLSERWHRLDEDNLEMTLTFTDPQTFTRPWTSDVKRFRLQKKGMPDAEMLEVIFIPLDEQDFNEKIRNPSNGVTK